MSPLSRFTRWVTSAILDASDRGGYLRVLGVFVVLALAVIDVALFATVVGNDTRARPAPTLDAGTVTRTSSPDASATDPSSPLATQTPAASPQTRNLLKIPTEDGDVRYLDLSRGFALTYPGTWTVREEGPMRLESPGGRISMSFGVAPSGDLAAAAAGSLRLLPFISDPRSDSMTHEQIAGARSLLVSGSASDDGRGQVRFLAIAVPDSRRTFVISVAVPARSDPTQVLPIVEDVVASFEILEPGAVTTA
jgi:hypothetical protein